MLGGGGVDGAIHRAAGPQLVEACRAVPEVEPGVRCPTGEAKITPGFGLKARHVVHTVGPVYRNDSVSAPLLAAAVSNSLRVAAENGLTSISFPGISTGVYGYPGDKAARVSITAVDETLAALARHAAGHQQQGQQEAAGAATAGVDVPPEQQAGTAQQKPGCSLKEVRFVLFGDALYKEFVQAAEATVNPSATPAEAQ
ncbi:hypothetical protein HXX76_012162 [Chlamydomonas incerta]|uniref:Macro domain-containing protein n=1 Tax=Chlamydomonas incerta TaxID=51695 RepID=A0A835VWM0_CHLIN|nr:hypothetical protein HXX76_012162 [Chlamydomonas incerta]|eukprot:KAG2427841.1 hypothetical protein HXX76_012162 [Chlamydomonas incerta]